MLNRIAAALLLGTTCALVGCRSLTTYAPVRPIPGDEIIVAGQRFHTGTRVVTWKEAKGYDGYSPPTPTLRRRFSSSTNEQPTALADTSWDLSALQRVVDQFVLHYDACGLSQLCFQALHSRGLSVHFLLDIDGTVYQTLDLQERALHATIANERSIGIEIANIGAYPPDATQALEPWYAPTPEGDTALTIPARLQHLRVLTPDFHGRPTRSAPVTGKVQGETLTQYDLTREQYAALVKLTAALSRIFPKIPPRYPHAFLSREPIREKLSDRRLAHYRGVLAHYHIQKNKVDPGPAFDWPWFMAEVRAELKGRQSASEPSAQTQGPP